MKRKIALVLAAAMTVTMLPLNAMASSSNSLSTSNTSIADDKILIKNIDDNDVAILDQSGYADALASGTAVSLQIRPTSEVEAGESIILTVENGKFDSRLYNIDPFQYSIALSSTVSMTYSDLEAEVVNGDYDTVATKYLSTRTRQVPYYFKAINSEQVEVFLWPINDTDANSSSSKITDGSPYYSIALPITTEDSEEGSVTVTIDSNDSAVTSGTYTVATVTDSDGSTTASVVAADVDVTSNETYTVPDITIKEDLAGTFDGQTIKVKLNGNYEWSKTGSVVAGVNCTSDTVVSDGPSIDGRTLEFTLATGAFNSSKTSSVILQGAVAEVKDDDTYGDINVTISGDSGITTQTLKVGERADYGFELTALEEAPTIFAGRTPFGDDMDEDDFVTAEFEFGETTPDTWLTGRKLEFTVPEGVKIVGYDITKTKYLTNFGSEAKIVDDGQTLRFDSISSQSGASIDENNASYFDIELYITASIEYSGDVTVSVAGAGLDADTLSDLVVATIVSPVTVEAATTKANIGYKSLDTADIVITENTYGALIDDEDVVITLDDTYAADIAFDDTDAEASVDGELEIKSFKTKNGAMYFTVDSESYSAPSTVTISNVAVGTTRSIPYGSYKIIVGGSAIVNNYDEDENVDQKSTIIVEDGSLASESEVTDSSSDFYKFDKFEDEGYEFDDYLEIITETITLDGEVRVTIGENYLVMDGETVEMDAAAYIQTSSNSTMVPIRFVALALGVDQDAVTENADDSSKIAWDATSKTATIIYAAGSQQKIIQFTAGSSEMIVDGVSITMDNGVVAEIVDGRMYVPFRALGQALGVSVSWDADTRTAIYNEK